MAMNNTAVGTIAREFNMKGFLVDTRPYGNGHINDTYLVRYNDGGKITKYIIQRINTDVFKDYEGLMNNIVGVTEFMRAKLNDLGRDGSRGALTVIKTIRGKSFYIDGYGDVWRAFIFIDDAVSLDLPEDENDFYQSAVAFGEFQRMLADYPAETLVESIPDFHNTPVRYEAFLKAVEADVCGRASGVEKEIEFVKSRREFMSVLMDSHASGKLPLKVTHNDTKMNNVMLDKDTREPVCVVDLDTIMPGFSVNDFGDSIRFGASTAAEDEKDLNLVHFSINMFETYTRGFLKGCAGSLTEAELDLLPEGAKMMTLECGMRFLTDYLSGDTYFKTAYKEHNLVRCRTQFKLVSEMEEQWDNMKKIVSKYK